MQSCHLYPELSLSGFMLPENCIFLTLFQACYLISKTQDLLLAWIGIASKHYGIYSGNQGPDAPRFW